ncbi:MAG TPA: hypothetical protein VM553_17595, partial [Dongiaceae bacterium]|nr:hypothetical protein [Dongiaceae bacterium]
MKSVFRMTALAVAVLGVAACVRQVWQVHYSVEGNDYTHSQTVVAGPNGHSYVAGVTKNQSAPGASDGVFLADFDAGVKLMWELLLPAYASNVPILASGKVLAVDAAGNSYLAWG